MFLTIEYTDGTKEEKCVDDVSEGKQCLRYYIRFGVNAGEYSIPFERIKQWKIER